jgi:hypothetical protein
MGWEPAVLRKYNTTGHFRLLSQLRSELKANPLVRPKDGQSIGEVNRSKSLIRAIEGRSQGYGRSRRGGSSQESIPAPLAPPALPLENAEAESFRQRLNGVELR